MLTQAMCLHSWSLSSEFALRHAAKVQSANSAGKYLLNCCLVPVICVIVRRKALECSAGIERCLTISVTDQPAVQGLAVRTLDPGTTRGVVLYCSNCKRSSLSEESSICSPLSYSFILVFQLYGARATHTPGLRSLSCPSMPQCQARACRRVAYSIYLI